MSTPISSRKDSVFRCRVSPTKQRLVSQIGACERELSHLPDEHLYGFIFRTLFGARDVTAAWLLGEIGDCRTRFETARAMQALEGIADKIAFVREFLSTEVQCMRR